MCIISGASWTDLCSLIGCGRAEKCLSQPIAASRNNTTSYEKLTGKTADVPAVNPFTDTNDTDILKAYNLGIINGRGNGIFDPNANIQRQEAAAMLSRTAAAIGTPLTGDDHPFTDGIASWANADVARVYNAGVMKGIGGTNFAPTSSYTVQQTLMTLVRLNDYIGN